MGRRGPRPTPTEILKLRGSTLVTERRVKSEAKGPPGKPTCPSWLDANAKGAWRQLVPMLEEMGVLTRIDGNALTRYCRMWSRWRKAEEFLESKGEVYPIKDEQGNQVPRALSTGFHRQQVGPAADPSRTGVWHD